MDRRFLVVAIAVAAAIIVFVGFAPTYYLRPRFQDAPLPFYLHVHGFVFTAWMVLFVVQTALIAVRRTGVHRRLGSLLAGWAGVMVIVGLWSGALSMKREIANGHADAALTFFLTPVLAMLVFGTLVGAGVLVRRRPSLHRPLMLLATINLLDAAFARWPVELLQRSELVGYAATDSLILAGVASDLVAKRGVSPAWLWGGALVVGCQAIRTPLGQTEAWHAIASVLLGA